MSTSVKNTIVTLVTFTLVFAAYYFYVQNKTSVLQTSAGGEVTDQMLANARAFIAHSATLSSISLNTDLFNDPVFRSYRSFTTPVEPMAQGRTNPFDEADLESYEEVE